MLLPLYPLPRRRDDALDRRVALSGRQVAAGRRGAALVFQLARDARAEEKADHVGAFGLAEAPSQRGRFARDAAREGRQKAHPAVARRALEERAGRAPVREAGFLEPKGAVTAPAGRLRLANPAARAQSLSAMRRLLLVRHAKAEPPMGSEDYARPLIAGALAARDMLPDTLIHSGAARAKETAEIFAETWDKLVPVEEEIGLYDAAQDVLFQRARALRDGARRVALVGHNPGVGELASSLVSSGPRSTRKRMQNKFPTCAVAALDFDVENWRDVGYRAAKLALFLTPSDLEDDR